VGPVAASVLDANLVIHYKKKQTKSITPNWPAKKKSF
jgi:hypothetical protein